MKKTITICTEHSTRHTEKTQAIHLDLEGGSPWFGYLWINDEIFVIKKTNKGFEVEKVE